jgi:Tfp pilus assembly protein PilO
MADLSQARKRIIATIIALGIADAGMLIYLALPYRAGAAQPAQVEEQAKRDYRQLARTNVPLRGIDQKLTQAGKDDAAFMENRLPNRYSDVVAELGKIADANHITISAVTYKETPDKELIIDDLEMRAGLIGPYINLVKFMNAVERSKMFFIIDGVSLTGQSGRRAGEVRLEMKIDTYLRGES